MESTEKCEVVIQHFNGKYLKTPPGIPGESHLFCFTLLSHHPFPFFFFFGWGRHHFAIRNCLSNSLMVIPHLRFAGQLDRLRTLLFLTSEANCRGSGSIADGSIGLFLAHSLTSSLRVTISLPGGAQAAGWNFSGRRKPS